MKSASLGKIIPVNLMVLSAAVCSPGALADEPPKDGLWRANGGLAVTLSAGNTRSQSLSLTADATRRTARNKWSLYAQALGTRAESKGLTGTTANQWSAGARYDHNLSKRMFGFTGLDFGRDVIRLLRLRSVASLGLGYHLVNTDDTQWDIFGGASYRSDEYIDPGVLVRNQLRTKFNSAEAMIGEDSTNTLTPSTTFKQRLTASHGLNSDGGYRATFDASLSVAINHTMSLKVSLQDRYDSLAEAPIKPNDLLFFTGVNVKFGG
jgi:putative salt-induced outer membrane protein